MDEGRRQFLRKTAAGVSTAMMAGIGGGAASDSLDLSAVNAAIERHRYREGGQNVYAGTIDKLYEDVPFYTAESGDGVLGSTAVGAGIVNQSTGSDPSEEALERVAWDEMYSDLGIQTMELEPGPTFRSPSHDFPERRLLRDREAELHVIPITSYDMPDYASDLSERVEESVAPVLEDVSFRVRPDRPVARGSPQETFQATQEQYLEDDPATIQMYLVDGDFDAGGFSTPNYNAAVTQVPDAAPGEWSDEWHDFVLHNIIHEAVGHSLLDFQFHPFYRGDVMSYNQEGEQYPTEFRGPSALWIDKYLDSELSIETGTKEIDGETFTEYRFQIEAGEVDRDRDIAVNREHLGMILQDRYGIDRDRVQFLDYRQEEQQDSAWDTTELVDVHTVAIDNQVYEIPIDHYLQEIRPAG
ncbi:MAG: hypothetical protein ABEI97_03520 [Candidatus Nanohaloarchaea archaeon]